MCFRKMWITNIINPYGYPVSKLVIHKCKRTTHNLTTIHREEANKFYDCSFLACHFHSFHKKNTVSLTKDTVYE